MDEGQEAKRRMEISNRKLEEQSKGQGHQSPSAGSQTMVALASRTGPRRQGLTSESQGGDLSGEEHRGLLPPP